ncbi:hypothetical protein [Bordetella bronchialis]|uniref:Fimbrial-type adhesion domain-containing protein n=1 Tax=Bordetella bronchialis TaxID=463025 RepID=A0ABM6CTG6_9BORD|nr:hypothetical protein [Bordetella bronchialis]ANN67362.1 hypothetical protein BAU06_14595 [Bordetella bronchialis]
MSLYRKLVAAALATVLSPAWAETGNILFYNLTGRDLHVQFSSSNCLKNPYTDPIVIEAGKPYAYPVDINDACDDVTIDWNLSQLKVGRFPTITAMAIYRRVRTTDGQWQTAMDVVKGDKWPVPSPVVFRTATVERSPTLAGVGVMTTSVVVDLTRDFMPFGK